MCGLGWLCRLCWLCVPLSLGILRRRSLLSLRSRVGVSLRLRLRSHVRVWHLRSRVGARGLRTGVRALCGSLTLSGRGGLCLERLRLERLCLGGLRLGLPLPLGCTPLRCGGSSTCASARSSPLGRGGSIRSPLPLGRSPRSLESHRSLEAQRILARRRRHVTAKSPGASRSAILTLRGQAICEVAAGLKLADKRNDPKNAQPQANQPKEDTNAHEDASVKQIAARGDRSGVGDVGDSKSIGALKVGVRAAKRVDAPLIGAESRRLVVAPVQPKVFARGGGGYRAITTRANHHAGGLASVTQV